MTTFPSACKQVTNVYNGSPLLDNLKVAWGHYYWKHVPDQRCKGVVKADVFIQRWTLLQCPVIQFLISTAPAPILKRLLQPIAARDCQITCLYGRKAIQCPGNHEIQCPSAPWTQWTLIFIFLFRDNECFAISDDNEIDTTAFWFHSWLVSTIVYP